MMRSALDVLLDMVAAGETLTVYVIDSECEHPELSPLTSYTRGCRCHRCSTTHNAGSRASWLRCGRRR